MKSSQARLPALRVGTRGSALALRQTAIVIEALQRVSPQLTVTMQVIRAHGDEPQLSHMPAPEEEGETPGPAQGTFVRAIEAALLEGRIDLAVHSFKDMPSAPTRGLQVAAFPPRDDPRDVLVAAGGRRLEQLPPAGTVGTGSPRRRALLLSLRPDLKVVPLRGNVDSRLRRVAEGDVDAIVVAAAGLHRLGRESEITERFDPRVFTPAIGQGILAVQTRADDETTAELVRQIDDPATRACALAERGVAMAVQAGCQTAIAASASSKRDRIEVIGFMLARDGCTALRAHEVGATADAQELGERVGAALLAQWGDRP